MRFILEHPWLAFVSIGAVAIALLWIGLRDGKKLQIKIGAGVFCVAVLACVVGIAIETPTEHAKKVVYAFIHAAEEKNYSELPALLNNGVILVDYWRGLPNIGIESIEKNITKLHQKHELRFNTIFRFQPVEREKDVLVELSLISRVSGIGTVPSRWRILVMPNDDGIWKIDSIDAVEIMGRSFR